MSKYGIILPGGRLYFEGKEKVFEFSWVGASLRTMFPTHPAYQGVVQRLPLRGHLEDRLIPRFGADELFLHYGEDV